MITITTEFLDKNWRNLTLNRMMPVSLSEWDEGDAYTEISIGMLPSQKIIFGSIVFDEDQASDFQIVVRLHKISDEQAPYIYLSPDGGRYVVTAEKNINGSKQNIEIKIASISKDLASRRQGIIETDLLKNTSVLIIGLGTGGVHIALELAKTGVGKFILIDPDRLEAGNISRHHAGISFIGRKKVLAGRDLILEKNPQAIIEVHSFRADDDHSKQLSALIESTNLTICATDNRESKLLINSLCVDANKVVIFGGANRRAYGGRVFRVLPRESACYHCFVLAVPEKEADQEISSEDNAREIAYSDKPVPVEPGLSMDVLPIALMVSKLALQELIKGKQSTLHILDGDFGACWYFWINRPEPKTDYASLAPLSESIDEMTILRWYGVHLDKNEGCPTCGNFEKALREKYKLDIGEMSPPQILASPFSEKK